MEYYLSHYDDESALWKEMQEVVDGVITTHNVSVCGIGTDYDDDNIPFLVIELCYEESITPIEAKTNSKLTFEIREKLKELQDFRFPYIYHNLPNNQPVKTAC